MLTFYLFIRIFKCTQYLSFIVKFWMVYRENLVAETGTIVYEACQNHTYEWKSRRKPLGHRESKEVMGGWHGWASLLRQVTFTSLPLLRNQDFYWVLRNRYRSVLNRNGYMDKNFLLFSLFPLLTVNDSLLSLLYYMSNRTKFVVTNMC